MEKASSTQHPSFLILPFQHLWGLRSMERQNAVIDTRVQERKAYLGDDVRIVPGPKTRIIQMHQAESGHLMVPYLIK